MFVAGFFIVGFPTETEDDMRATYDFAIGSELHQAMFFIAIPFPGTRLAGHAHRVWPGFSGNVYNRSGFNMSDVPDARFVALRRRAIARFYGSPVRLFRLIRDFPNRAALPRYLPFMVRSVVPGSRTTTRQQAT
jgi:hypothetical protein